MKQVSNGYKSAIKSYGKEINSYITYTQNNQTITLDASQLNAITPSFEGAILKSVMKQIVIDSNVEIPLETEINCQFGVKVNGTYEYIDYGNYIVYKIEKKEDTNSYEITCYDKMLYSMVKYEAMNITYPITIRGYLIAICNKLGLQFQNSFDTFANYDKLLPNELYLNSDGQDIGYTFRDVLDEIAQATASTICINSDDKLELRYIEAPRESKNILDTGDGFRLGYLNTSGVFVAQNQTALFNQNIPVEVGETYCYSTNQNIDNMVISYFGANNNFISRVKATSTDRIVREVPNNVAYVKLAINYNNSATMTQTIINSLQVMVEKNSTRTSYEPHILADTIDERSLKDVNVNFGEKYGPINSIVLSRASDSDSVYIQDEDSIAQNGLCELKISENQIMNGNDRDEYLPDLLETLDGLEYYINDYTSTGITYLELCDRYNIEIGENTYGCIMFNDEVNITQGLEENVNTEMPEETETDYTKADKTDRRLNQTTLIVDKHEQEIQSLINKVQDLSKTVEGAGQVQLEDAYEGRLHKLEIRGNVSLVYPNNQNRYGAPIIIGDELVANNDTYVSEGIPYLNRNILYPSTTLYPKDSYLLVDDTLYKLDFEYLNYMNETVYDKYVYEEGKQWIERNVGFDANGDMYQLVNTYKEIKPDIDIEIKSNSLITLLSHSSAILKAEYLIENQYTEIFATQAYVNSEIKQTADAIELQVDAKVDEDEIVAKLNLGIQDGQGVINLVGNTVTIDSDYFTLDETGHIDATSGEIAGFNMTDKNFNNNISGLYDFSKYDLNILKAFVLNYLVESDNDIALYDMNGSGTLSGQDYSIIKTILIGTTENTKQASGKFVINSDNPKNCVQMLNSNNEPVVSMGVGGVNASVVATENLAVMDLADWESSSEAKGVYGNKNGELTATVSVSSQAFINTSSETKKKNINKVKSGLDILKDIDIYTYNYNEENRKSNKKHYGVVIGDDYNYSTEITDNKNEGVDLYSFISVCCASIKEQQEEIEQLQKEIKSLKEEKDGKDKLSK